MIADSILRQYQQKNGLPPQITEGTTMNEIEEWNGIQLPIGTSIIEEFCYYTSTYKPDDTYTESLVLDVRGLNVQIIRYNRRNDDMIVFIKGRGRPMSADKVDEYIRNNT